MEIKINGQTVVPPVKPTHKLLVEGVWIRKGEKDPWIVVFNTTSKQSCFLYNLKTANRYSGFADEGFESVESMWEAIGDQFKGIVEPSGALLEVDMNFLQRVAVPSEDEPSEDYTF